MFNFSANHLLLLSRMEYHLCRVPHEGRLHPPGLPPLRLHQIPNHHVRPLLLRVGKGQQRGQTYLVIESVKRDTKHSPDPQLRLEWTAREKRT